jgi:GT2 family glycosyltransferase
MAPDDGIRLVLVVVPVRDEEELVGQCLDALEVAVDRVTAQPSHSPSGEALRVRTIVVLDRCVDGSAEVVAGRPWAETVVSTAGRVGAARAFGVQVGLATHDVAPHQIWIATTDADSRVPPDWLTHQLDLARHGAQMFRGLVEPDIGDCGPAAYAAWQSRYLRRDGHPHVHGASLGVRADAYQACGGFDPLAMVDEDVRLFRNAEQRSLAIIASATATVATSGRLLGRVAGPGFAAYLSNSRARVAADGRPE